MAAVAAFHRINRSDNPPLIVSMNELLQEQAALGLGSLISMDCDWSLLMAAIFPARTGSFLYPATLKWIIHIHFTDCSVKHASTGVSSGLFQIDFFPLQPFKLPVIFLPGFHWFISPTAPPDTLTWNPFPIRCRIYPFVPSDASSSSSKWLLQSVIASHEETAEAIALLKWY